MANLNGFDANTVDPATDFEPLPAGKYLAVITDSEMKPTKAGTGSYLQIVWELIDGDFKGRKLWSRLNLDNPNATAVEIAQRVARDLPVLLAISASSPFWNGASAGVPRISPRPIGTCASFSGFPSFFVTAFKP